MYNPQAPIQMPVLLATLKDHQGNLTATISGNTVERLSYDAWGNLRDPDTWTNGQNALSLSPIIKCFV